MVETQEAAATLSIVDNMEEQELLESLIDDVKPPYRPGTEKMHYMFKTAFRYPPLKYGSRFGTRAMPSYFYASEETITALAETAYYRFVFLRDMAEPYPSPIDSHHSIFSVTLKSKQCLDLYDQRFESSREEISSPVRYALSQTVGAWATQELGAQMIRFKSARHAPGTNVAVFEPRVIVSRAPNAIQSWLCRTSNERISFSSREAKAPVIFPVETFMVDGKFPRPA